MKQLRKLYLIFIVFAITLVSGACQSKNTPLNPKKPVTITLWHNYGGVMQKSMDELVDSFNSSIGKKQGIIVNVTAVSSSKELSANLDMILDDDPAAPKMPNITIAYPRTAIKLAQKDMLADLSLYFNESKTKQYVDAFIEEGTFQDGLYVFPVAKSTEVLFLNQTLFDRFANETGASIESLATFEGICEISEQYYQWCGKHFFTADSWFNLFAVAGEQAQDPFLHDEELDTNSNCYQSTNRMILDTVKKGGIQIYDGYSSDLAKTGDIVCSLGSTAGILYYGDEITYPDNTSEAVSYSILPYPTGKDGKKIALQRGNGMVVKKGSKKEEYACSVFLEWLTKPTQNLKFIQETGYLPVTKKAYQQILSQNEKKAANTNIDKLLTTAVNMQSDYTFYIPPVYDQLDKQSSQFETEFKTEAAAYMPSSN